MLNFAKEAIENSKEMGIDFSDLKAGKASIKVVCCGGMGSNAGNWLFNKGVSGATIYALNTDAQHLEIVKADEKLLIGRELTRGLGAGGDPTIGRMAAKETIPELKKVVSNCDMVFVVAGMGGGTGTGSAPVVASIAKSTGALVIGTVTMPFDSERARIEKAEFGLQELRESCHTVIVIDNNRLVDIAGQLPIAQAFAVANELISTMIKGIVETITIPALVNLDYADVKAIMHSGRVAVVGIGESNTQNKVQEAVQQALTHPLLDVDYKGAQGALINVTCGEDLKLEELTKITESVAQNLSSDAQVIFGARVDPKFNGKVRVITIITGVQSPYILGKPEERELAPQLEMIELGIDVFR